MTSRAHSKQDFPILQFLYKLNCKIHVLKLYYTAFLENINKYFIQLYMTLLRLYKFVGIQYYAYY